MIRTSGLQYKPDISQLIQNNSFNQSSLCLTLKNEFRFLQLQAVQYITSLKRESSRHGAAAPVPGQEFYIRGPGYQYYYDYMPDEMFDTPGTVVM